MNLYIIAGPPASGKSVFADTLSISKNIPIIRADDIFALAAKGAAPHPVINFNEVWLDTLYHRMKGATPEYCVILDGLSQHEDIDSFVSFYSPDSIELLLDNLSVVFEAYDEPLPNINLKVYWMDTPFPQCVANNYSKRHHPKHSILFIKEKFKRRFPRMKIDGTSATKIKIQKFKFDEKFYF